MKYCRFQLDGQARYGVVESVTGTEQITRLLLQPPHASDGDLEGIATRRMDRIPLAEATLLAPVEPTKIVCVGRNYREHAAELNNEIPVEPLLFFKPPSSLLAHGGTILRPKVSERTDYEGELAVVIARRCHKLRDDEDVRPYILGYTCLNDFTARDLQKKDGQWAPRQRLGHLLPGWSTSWSPTKPASIPGPASRLKPASMATSGNPAIREISSSPSMSSCATLPMP